MMGQAFSEEILNTHRKFFYGWVIVAVCAVMVAVTFGLMYSYSVFFKPIADYFHWDRASVSFIYSGSLIIGAAISIGVGWLADRYGSARLMAFCGFMIGAGLILSSQVHNLWQLFLTYGLIEAIGIQGCYGVVAALVSRWFVKNRGLALGITSSGSGLGTFLIVPGNERLINAFGLTETFIIAGSIAGILMISLSFLLRSAPRSSLPDWEKLNPASKKNPDRMAEKSGMNLSQAIKDRTFILISLVFFLVGFSTQIVIIHLVNYATDMGIGPLVATTFMSVIGLFSIAGRLAGGVSSEKIGVHNVLILVRILLIASFICLILAKAIWEFYLFAIIFSVAFGGEITQAPLFMGRHYGTKTMATLVNYLGFFICIGGAAGAWAAGKIFDTTQSYHWAFVAGAIVTLASLIIVLLLKRKERRNTAASLSVRLKA